MQNPAQLEILKELIQEVTHLAHASNIHLGENQEERVLGILSSLPANATSSLHRDFQKNKVKNELESLCGFVVRQGNAKNLSINTFEHMYLALKNKLL